MSAPRCALYLYAVLTFLSSTQAAAFGRYKSIISFGDSLADTGNLLSLSLANSDVVPPFARLPYGKTFFHHPTGRFSDGRVILDFIAGSLGFPFVSPYFERKNVNRRTFGEGVNFAVAGATVLDDSFFLEKGIHLPVKNVSLGIQMGWFKELLASHCQKSSDCKEFLCSSLVLMGEIGGNDYNHPLFDGRSLEDVRTSVRIVVKALSSAINELIELGAETIVVPGNLPIGCSAAYLTIFQSSNKNDYDNFGCFKKLNEFAEYHNRMLQNELNSLQKIHHQANIVYADYYNAAAPIYHYPNKYGFKSAFSACCGGGGPYNFNASAICGLDSTTCCEDPSVYVSWDGIHLTEEAYRIIAHELILHGTPYANLTQVENYVTSEPFADFMFNGKLNL